MQLPGGKTTYSKVILLSAVYDIPAKGDVLRQVHFKAEYLCSYCYHPGRILKTANGFTSSL